MNIYQKIAEVMKDVQYLCKDDKIEYKNTKYKAISEEKVTSTVRESLIRHGIVIIPVEQDHKREGTLSTVDTSYRIQNIDDIEDYTIAKSSGTGADTQDKGVGKAMTYSYKYLLLRTFAIPTGEDPDKISSAELDAKKRKATTNNVARAARETFDDHHGDSGDLIEETLTIDKAKVKVVNDLLKQTNSDVPEFLKYYKIKKVEDMTVEVFVKAVNALKSKLK